MVHRWIQDPTRDRSQWGFVTVTHSKLVKVTATWPATVTALLPQLKLLCTEPSNSKQKCLFMSQFPQLGTVVGPSVIVVAHCQFLILCLCPVRIQYLSIVCVEWLLLHYKFEFSALVVLICCARSIVLENYLIRWLVSIAPNTTVIVPCCHSLPHLQQYNSFNFNFSK